MLYLDKPSAYNPLTIHHAISRNQSSNYKWSTLCTSVAGYVPLYLSPGPAKQCGKRSFSSDFTVLQRMEPEERIYVINIIAPPLVECRYIHIIYNFNES